MKRVIIMRGVPGSGKSTLAREMFPNAVFCSADDYFMVEGKYCFDPSKIALAHQACWRKFYGALCDQVPLIVVDNSATNVAEEVAPYVLPSEVMGCQVEVLTIWADPELAASRNVHGVPAKTVLLMAELLAEEINRLPLRWNHTFIF
jgi:predicted kinase